MFHHLQVVGRKERGSRVSPNPTPLAFPLDDVPPGTHPGVVLRQWLRRRKLTQTTAADMLGVSRHNLNFIIAGRRRVTPSTALRLGRLFDTGADYWTTLQSRYDLSRARKRASADDE